MRQAPHVRSENRDVESTTGPQKGPVVVRPATLTPSHRRGHRGTLDPMGEMAGGDGTEAARTIVAT